MDFERFEFETETSTPTASGFECIFTELTSQSHPGQKTSCCSEPEKLVFLSCIVIRIVIIVVVYLFCVVKTRGSTGFRSNATKSAFSLDNGTAATRILQGQGRLFEKHQGSLYFWKILKWQKACHWCVLHSTVPWGCVKRNIMMR